MLILAIATAIAAVRTIVLDTLPGGSDRLVFPVVEDDRAIYLIDITLPFDLPADRRVLLIGLLEYFGHHIALLDYGEAETLTGPANRKTFDKRLFEFLGKAVGDDARRTLPHRAGGTAAATNTTGWESATSIISNGSTTVMAT